MTIDDVVNLTREALFLIIKLSAPVLLISLAVGLLVSIFQTVTSIQEQTLTFIPKILAVFTGIIILGYWMLSNIKDYIVILWSDFASYIH